MRRSRHMSLRAATAELHAELDTRVGHAGFFASRSAYGTYLQRLHLLHRMLAERVGAHEADLVARYPVNDRVAWLADDLLSLGLAPLPLEAAHGKRAFTVEGRAGLLGYLYVMLGASLGSRVLVREAEALLRPLDTGTTYLRNLAQWTGWPAFLDQLEADAAAGDAGLVEGATQTFELFMDYLTETVPA